MTREVTISNRGGTIASVVGKRPGRIADQPWLCAVLALVGGLVGGALANRLAAAIPAIAADSPAKAIAAEEILLVDAKGKPHASLHLNDGGLPVLQMYDAAGKDRIGIGFGKNGTVGLDIADAKGNERLLLTVNDDSVPALRLFDDTAMPRMLAGVDSHGDSALDFYDRDGKLLRELP